MKTKSKVKQSRLDTAHCAIIRLLRVSNAFLTTRMIEREIEEMLCAHESGELVDLHEELRGMEKSEISAERKELAQYLRNFK